ncbi:unnamed protein product [Effrenium voratum]|uniref:Uncharacterized protein n=1 Tax=Effrenium voratum TaxID=2562239 RepID=A0AA36MPI0_9DINO|nr:unnamed protein product [Effrenium voratum]
MVKRTSEELHTDSTMGVDGQEEDSHPVKRSGSPASTAISSPEMGPTPEDRDHAHHSNLWRLPVKELKARLEALGADLKGVTEKTELVNLLEQPLGCIMLHELFVWGGALE